MKIVWKAALITGVCIILASKANAASVSVEVTATVPGCGDSIISQSEQCDGAELGGSSCASIGFSAGVLSCSSACTFNTQMCTFDSEESGTVSGGFSSVQIPNTNVVFSGKAYPLSKVFVLKDGQLVATAVANQEGVFTATISGLSTGQFMFSLYAQDQNTTRSKLFSFQKSISSGVTTKFGSIFLSPTIRSDKAQVKKGDAITFSGYAIPNSKVDVSLSSGIVQSTQAGEDGAYSIVVATENVSQGSYVAKVRSSIEGLESEGGEIDFTVGIENIESGKEVSKADLNKDGRINLVDFSIQAFWYKRANPPESVDLNGDKKVDLLDFSIMVFHWTG